MSTKKEKHLQAILLNKVSNLEWYYFDVDFKDSKSMSSKIDFTNISNQIKKDKNGGYTYKGKKITTNELFISISNFLNSVPDVATQVLKRIFDSNSIDNESDYDQGFIGKLNKKESSRRTKYFEKRRKKEFPIRKNVDFVILAEGDSWFQFPKVYFLQLTEDIIKNLTKDRSLLIRTLASAGDWLSNILHARDYIDELPKINPDVLLVSGGGNDLVGNDRIAQMVSVPSHKGRSDEFEEMLKRLYELRHSAEDIKEHVYLAGSKFIEEEFIQFLNLILVQYYLLFKNLSGVDKYKEMMIFTQGYDYCKPRLITKGNNWILRLYEQFQVGGKWISLPLATKGIGDPKDQEAIVYFMIHEFNELLIQLANYDGFPNVRHVDCRGIAPNETDWIDELHLKKGKYKLIADEIRACIYDQRDLRSKKVIKVLNDKEFSCQI